MIERPIKVEFIDIAYLYHIDDSRGETENFYVSLSKTDQLEIFNEKVIMKMVDFNYDIVKRWTLYRQFFPFMSFQVTLFTYLNAVFQNPKLKSFDFPMQLLLAAFSWYYLSNEFGQMRKYGAAWFKSILNYINIVTPITISTVLVVNILSLPMHKDT